MITGRYASPQGEDVRNRYQGENNFCQWAVDLALMLNKLVLALRVLLHTKKNCILKHIISI